MGDAWTFTIRRRREPAPRTIEVSYDGFTEDVQAGDTVLVDGGMVSFLVKQVAGPDALCECVEGGILSSRANLTFRRGGRIIRGKNSQLPTLSSKDWRDIEFAVNEGVDFVAVSFVKSAEPLDQLRAFLRAQPEAAAKEVGVIGKIESMDALPRLAEIIDASDAVMVARGDLGAQIPLAEVPIVQRQIVNDCRQRNKPVLVASHFLSSMLTFPTPTRAEVADVADAVRQKADALLLTGETAMGLHPEKSLEVVRATSTRVEGWCRDKKHGQPALPALAQTPHERVVEQITASAASLAGGLGAKALIVYTKTGQMARFLSRARPDCPVFALTDSSAARRKMNLAWGLVSARGSAVCVGGGGLTRQKDPDEDGAHRQPRAKRGPDLQAAAGARPAGGGRPGRGRQRHRPHPGLRPGRCRAQHTGPHRAGLNSMAESARGRGRGTGRRELGGPRNCGTSIIHLSIFLL